MSVSLNLRIIAAAFALGATLAPAAAVHAQPAHAAPSQGDPWESFNRSMFRFGMGLDRAIARPVAKAYIAVAPKPVRAGVGNVLQNLAQPLIFVNDVLQGRPNRAGRTFGRFATNSTLGVAGLFDIAGKAGHANEPNDFGMTLAHYGASPGPYLFVPLLGPSSVRDLTGRGVDFAADPLKHVRYEGSGTANAVHTGATIVHQRALIDPELEALEATAADPYATLRSVYRQNRQAQIDGGKMNVQDLPDMPGDDGAGEVAPAN